MKLYQGIVCFETWIFVTVLFLKSVLEDGDKNKYLNCIWPQLSNNMRLIGWSEIIDYGTLLFFQKY